MGRWYTQAALPGGSGFYGSPPSLWLAQESRHIQLMLSLHVMEQLAQFLILAHYAAGCCGKAGGDQGDPDIVIHRRIEDHTKDDVSLRVHRFANDLRCLIDLK